MDLHFTRMLLPLTIVLLLLVHGAIFSNAADSGKDKDKEECTEQLVGLATCLPYVGGKAKAPTPDCCNGLKQVLRTNKKCLCVIIQDRNDPDLGLTINVNLALGLPTVCNAPANVSQCPELLHLPPNSPDAQVFYQFKQASSNTTKTPASTPETTVKANSTTTATSPPGGSSTGQVKSSGISDSRNGMFGLVSNVVGGLLLCFWASHFVFV